MNTTQMKFQKIVVKLAILLAAIAVFYSLIFSSQLYGFIDVNDASGDIGYFLNEKVQPFNRLLFTLTVCYLLVSLTLLVFFSQSRRNYYLSNYITIGVTAVLGVALSVYALLNIFTYMAEFLTIDFVAVNEYLTSKNIQNMTAFPWTFVLGILVFAGIVADAVLLVINAFWKSKAMKKDKEDNAEIDAQIYEAWRLKEEDLDKEASKYES